MNRPIKLIHSPVAEVRQRNPVPSQTLHRLHQVLAMKPNEVLLLFPKCCGLKASLEVIERLSEGFNGD